MKNKIIDNLKTLFFALIIALIIRSFFFQPFYIPSSSMEPNLLIGDRLFVSKYEYGFSKHSFPFSPSFTEKRFLYKKPNRGDVIVFKTPADNRTDYIKRLIGLPGDTIQIIDGDLYINNKKIIRKRLNVISEINCGNEIIKVNAFVEKLPNGRKYTAVYREDGTMKNTDLYKVPNEHYFFMGDNRDCSRDSRFLSSVGYVSYINLVGEAKIIFLSNNTKKSSILKFWNWNSTLRIKRFFQKIL
jgi:signal peptidase I